MADILCVLPHREALLGLLGMCSQSHLVNHFLSYDQKQFIHLPKQMQSKTSHLFNNMGINSFTPYTETIPKDLPSLI